VKLIVTTIKFKLSGFLSSLEDYPKEPRKSRDTDALLFLKPDRFIFFFS